MLHYLFTNDLRRNQWPEILEDSAKLIRDEAVPDQHEDKSKNNYINTQQSYLCIHKGTKANELCCKGDVNAVILNFINRFQFPNARTESSFNSAVADHMAVAPLRCVVQLLFVLGMVDAGQAYMDCPEFAKYIICNSDVATGNLDLISLAQQIVSDRLSGVVIPPVPDTSTLSSMGIEWKHCPRQIGEVFYLLQFVPFIKLNGTRLELVMPSTIDANLAKMFFCIVNNHELWEPPNTSNWPDIQKSYLQYMDSGVTQYMTGGSNVGSESLPHVDVLTVALKMFAEKRKDDGEGGWKNEGWNVNGRIRAYFGGLTAAQIIAFTEEQFEEFFLGPIDPVTKKHKSADAMMWAGSTGSGWDNIKPDKPADITPALAGMAKIQQDPGVAAVFLQPGTTHPKGFGPSVTSELLMKFHPDACFKHGRVTHEVLTSLGLLDFPYRSNYSDSEYKQVCGVAAKIRDQMVAMKFPRQINEDGTEDPAKPDYLTVNEFIWFVNDKDNFKDIKNEVVKMAMTPAKHTPYDKTKGKKKTFESTAEDQLMLRILASLRTKPFVILAGHSGTGKSRMVKKLAYMTCRDNALHEGSDPGNYCMIEVKPNWHDSTELLGYFSSFGGDHYVKKQLIDFIMKAYAYPNVPFFVCLDEMNLAPVEQYFAEFLSALEDIHEDTDKMTAFLALDAAYKPESPSAAEEVIKYSSAELVKAIDYKDDPMLLEPKYPISRDWVKTHGLTIPKNLFVVGTVNMDESTNQFSRKVLDRAFTIEMTDACFEDFGDSTKDPTPTFVTETDTDHDLIDALLTGKKQSDKPLTKKVNPADPNGQLENMNALKEILAGTPFVVAYRFANEYALYEQALNKLDEKDAAGNSKAAENAKRAFDEVVLMKLLPRIAGEAKAVKAIYEGEKKGDGSIKKSGLLQLLPYDKDDATKQTQSGKKMREILGRGDLPYLTFWP